MAHIETLATLSPVSKLAKYEENSANDKSTQRDANTVHWL